MSVRLMGEIFETDLPAVEKLVLLAMADHARDDGTGCYPSVGTLARKTNQSRRGVQKIMRRLERAGWITPSKLSKGHRANEYRITLATREPGSLFPPTQQRTRGPSTANHSASNREPGSPESLRTVIEPSRQPAKNPQTDPRFQKIVEEFFRLSRAKGIEPAFDRSDGNQLTVWLDRHLNIPAEKILTTLANAFASSDPYPLRLGFRLREFLAHESKYQLGPLHKAVNGNANGDCNSKSGPEPLRRPKVTEEGLRIYEQHGLNPEWMQ